MLKQFWLAIVLLCSVAVFAESAHAQMNIAYVDAESVIAAMPDFKQVESELASYKKILEKQLQTEEKKLQDYYQDVMQKVQAGVLSPQQQKEAEGKLQKMQEDLQKKAGDADKQLSDKEAELTKPLYDKFNDALKTVAKTNNFAYILDKKLLLYSEGGIDATTKLKTQLGIQ